VSRGGSIDWYCPDRFDTPAVLCRVLDHEKGGYFSVAPTANHGVSRRYRGPTNILETLFDLKGGGQVRLTDFMPIHRRSSSRLGHDVGTTHQILRLVEGLKEPAQVAVEFKASFDFARAATTMRTVDGRGAIAQHGRERLVLYGPKFRNARVEDGTFRADLPVHQGEHSWLVLTWTNSDDGEEDGLDPDVSTRQLERTAEYWEEWAGHCEYDGRYKDAVLRSALALKLLIYEPTGAVVAAPTTSLPERIGGVRNWDYRYTWLRDASLMLYALSTLGYHEEATDFVGWLAQTCKEDPEARPQIMYTIDGQRQLPEHELGQLEGYRGSKPVRTGNAASGQHQLDIFGDVLSAAYHFRHAVEDQPSTPTPEPPDRMSRRNWQLLRDLVEDAAASWQQPDSGIWEVRDKPRHYVYSKLMCWTALDRGIKLAEEQGLPAPLDHWRQVRDEISAAILERGFNQKLGSFTQVLDGHELDASVLAIPRFGFLPATDPRVASTVDRISKDLTRNGLIERYRANDGLPGTEGTFALCTFWMIDALALGGRVDEARELFEYTLSFANDLGLLSEEIDPKSQTDTLLGNFPQGFSHMALIGAAVNLANAEEHGAEAQARTEPERAQNARRAG